MSRSSTTRHNDNHVIDWQSRLEPEERLLWSGRPVPVTRPILHPPMERSARLAISLLCGGLGLAALFLFLPATRGDPLFMAPVLAMAGALFLAVGYVNGGKVVVDRAILARTGYALTDRRAIIVRRLFGRTFAFNYSLRNMTPVTWNRAVPGHVIFFSHDSPSFQHLPSGGVMMGHKRNIVGFHYLADAERAWLLLRRLQANGDGREITR